MSSAPIPGHGSSVGNTTGYYRLANRADEISPKEEGRLNEEHVALVKQYGSKVETELSAIYAGILELLQSHLVPSATTGESKVFYLKLKGDYHQYLAGFKNGDKTKTHQPHFITLTVKLLLLLPSSLLLLLEAGRVLSTW
ncbi:hypothetical protein ACFX13_033489 [Malus domestica]|nr:14-3-3-like protein GF14 kappa [Malus domestica]